MVRALAITLLAGLLLAEPHAQQGAGWVEVASVRRHPPAENLQSTLVPEPGGRLRLRLTAERLSVGAFPVHLDQVVNAPGTARSDMFVLTVKLRDGGKV